MSPIDLGVAGYAIPREPDDRPCRATAEVFDRDRGTSIGWTLTCDGVLGHAGDHFATMRWQGETPDADLADPEEDFDVELDALPHEEAARRRLEVVTPNPLRTNDEECGMPARLDGARCVLKAGHDGWHRVSGTFDFAT